ncbi:hypothetical protein BBF96_00510 [Anoxybacter fermentans]|uniref:Glycosyltransferase 2-like domain-containing protein n=1 Tax=Anoxybacter fermentans TaxID=1323375 RepID=A0A3Q9HNG0_9FIRM|nr:glycosyltransferase family 2 protein [Anoxybacter fermentans]AZR72018.1 hypothetical protein BBF96_00510 [Anoxybacter fermentans]
MDNNVDIIIVNYNTCSFLKKCIKSIEEHTRYPYRLIIIDNNSKDGSKEYLDRLKQKGVTVIYNNENLGTSKAWNQGIKIGKGKYILFLNPDILVTPYWLTKMVACAESDKKIAVVGTKQVDQNGNIIYAGVIEKDGQYIFRGRGEKDEPTKYNQICDCATVSGACYLIKREYLSKIGYFDERFFMYAEETDYSYRARLLGYRVVYCPVTIIHYREGTPINPEKRYQMRQKSDKIFNEKWAGSRELRKLLISPEVLKKSQLIKGKKASVYLFYNGQKHLIPNKDIFNRLNLRWEDVKILPQSEVDKIPTGITIYI